MSSLLHHFLLQTLYFQGLHHFFKEKSNDIPFCVNTLGKPIPQTQKGISLLMNSITYLLSLIQFLYQQNCWLITFICKYIPLKQWAFDDSHSSKYHCTAQGMRYLS